MNRVWLFRKKVFYLVSWLPEVSKDFFKDRNDGYPCVVNRQFFAIGEGIVNSLKEHKVIVSNPQVFFRKNRGIDF